MRKCKKQKWSLDDWYFLLSTLLISCSSAFFIFSFVMWLGGFVTISVIFLTTAFICLVAGMVLHSRYQKTQREILNDMEDGEYVSFLKSIYLAGKNEKEFIWNKDWCLSRHSRQSDLGIKD